MLNRTILPVNLVDLLPREAEVKDRSENGPPKSLVGGSVFYWSDFVALSCVILDCDSFWFRPMASFFLKLSASISMMLA